MWIFRVCHVSCVVYVIILICNRCMIMISSAPTPNADGWIPTPTLNRKAHDQEIERQEWEAAALRELKEGKSAVTSDMSCVII